jgi:hypothetical protein
MGSQNEVSFDRVAAARIHAAQALELADVTQVPAEVTDALRECLNVLEAFDNRFDTEHAGHKHDDFVTWTIEDHACFPGGREIDVRLYYDWENYCPGDHVTPDSGGFARLEDIEVVAVRYFDEQGNLASLGDHYHDVAWELAEKDRSVLDDAVTSVGYARGVGETNPLLVPSGLRHVEEEREPSQRRMAPSARKRTSSQGVRKYG